MIQPYTAHIRGQYATHTIVTIMKWRWNSSKLYDTHKGLLYNTLKRLTIMKQRGLNNSGLHNTL